MREASEGPWTVQRVVTHGKAWAEQVMCSELRP